MSRVGYTNTTKFSKKKSSFLLSWVPCSADVQSFSQQPQFFFSKRREARLRIIVLSVVGGKKVITNLNKAKQNETTKKKENHTNEVLKKNRRNTKKIENSLPIPFFFTPPHRHSPQKISMWEFFFFFGKIPTS